MIRPAVALDAAALADVHISSWQVAYKGIFEDSFLFSFDPHARAEWWRATIEQGSVVHVAEDRQVVGFCFSGPALSDDGWGEVYAIYVHPDWWGVGHGRDLLRAGEESLRSAGFDRALLWVLERNERGRRFYERQGWVPSKPFRVEEIGGTQVTELRYETSLA